MPSNPAHVGSFTFLDYSKEKSNFQFNFGPITALTIAAFLTQFAAFRTATGGITTGTLIQDEWTGDRTRYSNTPPASQESQREKKFLVTYEGTTTLSIYRLEVPTADFSLSGLFSGNSDVVDLTQTEIAAWVTAFETLGKTPEQEAVNVLEMRAVGRAI